MNKRDIDDITGIGFVIVTFLAGLGIGFSLMLTIIALTIYGLHALKVLTL